MKKILLINYLFISLSCLANDTIFSNANKLYSESNYVEACNLYMQIIENGSFYIFDKELFKKNKVRLFGKIDHYKMEAWQVFEIDSHEDLELCKDLSKIKLVDGIYNE